MHPGDCHTLYRSLVSPKAAAHCARTHRLNLGSTAMFDRYGSSAGGAKLAKCSLAAAPKDKLTVPTSRLDLPGGSSEASAQHSSSTGNRTEATGIEYMVASVVTKGSKTVQGSTQLCPQG